MKKTTAFVLCLDVYSSDNIKVKAVYTELAHVHISANAKAKI